MELIISKEFFIQKIGELFVIKYVFGKFYVFDCLFFFDMRMIEFFNQGVDIEEYLI